jgi:hypothetical protein
VLEITKMTCRSLDLDHLELWWEIGNVYAPQSNDQLHEIYDYDFYVLRSGDSEGGPFDVIGGPFRDTYHFRDINVSLIHKWRTYFYKIRVVKRSSGETKEYGPVASQSPEPDLIAAEVISQEDVLFREFVGRRCWLFPVRTFGPRCSCWDQVLSRRVRTGHLPCFDTGFLGGFMSPIEFFAQIDPSAKSSTASPLGENQQVDTTGRTICFPLVSPNDIIVEAENKRWKVIKVTPTQRLRSVLRQELQLHQIPPGDIEYELPLNIDLRSAELSAERNFTNPQALPDDDYSDILATYGYPRGSRR